MRILRLLGLLLVTAVFSATAADPLESFNTGVTAYKAGDTQGALSAFKQARAGGLDDAALHLNLGLCYYRLGRLAGARAEFARLRTFAGYGHIADFHLGLVAAREGRRADAEALWLAVEQGAPQPAMRQRARIARSRLTGALDAAVSGYVLAATGHDTNPALIDEGVQADATSATTELLGTVAVPLSARTDAVDWLRAGAWWRSYSEDNGVDQRGLYAAFAAERARGQRRRTSSLEGGATQLDGEVFANTLGASLEDEPGPGRSGFALRGQLTHIGTGSGFGALEGWRLRGEIERLAQLDGARLRAGYQLELNDRESDAHAATRHRLSVALDHHRGRGWTLRYPLRWRASRYADGRSENLLQGGVQARRQLGGQANALFEYQYSRNASSVEVFDYDRHLLLVGLEWLPRAD